MIVIWSFSFVFVDIAVEFIPPLSIAFYRFIIASFTFLLIDLSMKLKRKNDSQIKDKDENPQKFSKYDWILLICASFTGVSLFFFAQYSAIEIIGPSLPALFVCLMAPLIITILALIFFNEKLSILKIIGFIIASFGGFLLVTGGDLTILAPMSPNFIGYVFALITPFLWATYSTITKKLVKNHSNIKILKYLAYFGTIELFVFLLINDELSIFTSNILNPILLLCAMYTGIICYILGYYIWQNSQAKLDSSKSASFLYIEPFLTLLFSFLLQRSETIVLCNIIWVIIVLGAVLIINYK